jgi:hypothetical protein
MTTDRRKPGERVVLHLLDPRSPTLDKDIDEFYAALMRDVARARQSAGRETTPTTPADEEREPPETQ